MLSCKKASELVSQALDRRLSWHEQIAVRLHLLICAACTRFKRQMEFLQAAARHYARHGGQTEGQDRLSPQARARIHQAFERQRG